MNSSYETSLARCLEDVWEEWNLHLMQVERGLVVFDAELECVAYLILTRKADDPEVLWGEYFKGASSRSGCSLTHLQREERG